MKNIKTVFYSKDAQFELTEEEFKKALLVWNSGKHCFIERLGVSLSYLYIWAGPKQENPNRKLNSDNKWCIKKFGTWFLEDNPSVRIDLSHYPELKNNDNETKILKS